MMDGMQTWNTIMIFNGKNRLELITKGRSSGLQTELNKRQLIFPVLRRIEVLLARLPAVSLSHIFVLLTKTVRYSIGAL